MAGEKKIENSETIIAGLKSESGTTFADKDVSSRQVGMTSDATPFFPSLAIATSSMKCETDQALIGEHMAYNPSMGCYNYYYPGCNVSFLQPDDNCHFQGDCSQTGVQSENGSYVYYMPGYDPYANGNLVGANGQYVGQQPYIPSPGYVQYPDSYGSETVSCFSWDSMNVGDVSNGNNPGFGTAFAYSNGLNTVKTNDSAADSVKKQPIKPLSQVPQSSSDFSAGIMKRYQPTGKFSSYAKQRQGFLPHNGPVNYRTGGRMWIQNDRYKKFNRNGSFAASPELTRGPRGQNRGAPTDSSVKKEELGLVLNRSSVNLPDFQTEYENAKFYVIKSYNEVDIHKSVKYAVWASTPSGNNKLDAAFHDAEAKHNETGSRCPIFLFFSVNGSGQFVGLAEMVGKVDFNKDMDFWQIDRWSGFFPVKWHILKDIPNYALVHITLENNEYKSVTCSRDTQEVGLKEGLEMLNIFKNYSAKSCLLDDFNFYEKQEKPAQTEKTDKSAPLPMDKRKERDFSKLMKPGERRAEENPMWTRRITDGTAALINQTKNLSLNDRNLKNNSLKKW